MTISRFNNCKVVIQRNSDNNPDYSFFSNDEEMKIAHANKLQQWVTKGDIVRSSE